jgi:hypothetical protein
MNKLKLISVVLLQCICALNFIYGQEGSDKCGTPNLTKEAQEALPYLANNKILLEALKEMNYELPDDYFQLAHEEQEAIQAEKITQRQEDEVNGLRLAPSYYIPLQIYIFTDGNGNNAANIATIDNEILTANLLLRQNGIPIVFYRKCGELYLNNPSLYNLESWAEVNQVWDNTLYSTDAMSIYYATTTSSRTFEGFNGVAQSAPSQKIILSQSRIQTTLLHELGHALGLQHTHNGRFPCTSNNETCDMCWQESVSRTRLQPFYCLQFIQAYNCEVNGDFLCDTPAEPVMSRRMAPGCVPDLATAPTDA